MVENAQPFRIDLDELEQISARVSRFTGFLNTSLDVLQQRISRVQQNWIDAMRSAGQSAHDRCTATIATNLAILGRSAVE